MRVPKKVHRARIRAIIKALALLPSSSSSLAEFSAPFTLRGELSEGAGLERGLQVEEEIIRGRGGGGRGSGGGREVG